ncbi:hypothetical protein WMY93_020077 [Mugilogobius chulae]|uniref:O(6)-methylguanine-induced apoptosis 2 n=1 Tax=Mugilogobius chulae TaxID=88201 RepID=A0AAW0NTJ3_9GOBI
MGSLYRDISERVVSIPSKHKTMEAISNTERKGFCSQTKRFPSQHIPTENPGPGSYDFNNGEVNSPSFSNKGTSGFVNSSKIQNGGSERFGPPGSSSFVSKTKRDSYRINKDLPSPCHYYIEDDIQHSSKAVLSPFRSKTQRLSGPKDNLVPGPGAYSPHQNLAPVKRSSLHPRSLILLSAPALTLPKPAPSPGPGHYDVCRNLSSKHTLPTAAFASKSDRISYMKSSLVPGPGFYDPHVSTKQSFFYSDTRIWLPV